MKEPDPGLKSGARNVPPLPWRSVPSSVIDVGEYFPLESK